MATSLEWCARLERERGGNGEETALRVGHRVGRRGICGQHAGLRARQIEAENGVKFVGLGAEVLRKCDSVVRPFLGAGECVGVAAW